mmetsp:Transcript_2260/g.6481  ORF Transcript_2260/g.6481 Transcript_2260/m.6481 type:complete len:277 (-) Transcript_2260:238-1068(-)
MKCSRFLKPVRCLLTAPHAEICSQASSASVCLQLLMLPTFRFLQRQELRLVIRNGDFALLRLPQAVVHFPLDDIVKLFLSIGFPFLLQLLQRAACQNRETVRRLFSRTHLKPVTQQLVPGDLKARILRELLHNSRFVQGGRIDGELWHDASVVDLGQHLVSELVEGEDFPNRQIRITAGLEHAIDLLEAFLLVGDEHETEGHCDGVEGVIGELTEIITTHGCNILQVKVLLNITTHARFLRPRLRFFGHLLLEIRTHNPADPVLRPRRITHRSQRN